MEARHFYTRLLVRHLCELLLDVWGMVGVLVDVCGWFAVLSERSERTVFQVECDVEEVCFIPILTDIFRPTFILSKE